MLCHHGNVLLCIHSLVHMSVDYISLLKQKLQQGKVFNFNVACWCCFLSITTCCITFCLADETITTGALPESLREEDILVVVWSSAFIICSIVRSLSKKWGRSGQKHQTLAIF